MLRTVVGTSVCLHFITIYYLYVYNFILQDINFKKYKKNYFLKKSMTERKKAFPLKKFYERQYLIVKDTRSFMFNHIFILLVFATNSLLITLGTSDGENAIL